MGNGAGRREANCVNPTAAAQSTAHQDFAGAENVHKGCPEILSKLSAHFCSEIWAERTDRDLAYFDDLK
jgi:hypothetical protein